MFKGAFFLLIIVDEHITLLLPKSFSYFTLSSPRLEQMHYQNQSKCIIRINLHPHIGHGQIGDVNANNI